MYSVSFVVSHTVCSTGNWDFQWEDIRVYTDDTWDSERLPTKANILGAMKWLVKDAEAGDSLFFFCERTIYIPDWLLIFLRRWSWYTGR